MEINCSTRYMAIIGCPLEHSLSPIMYNGLFRSRQLNYVYLPFATQPEQLEQVLNSFRALNFIGFNVTIPFKQKVIPFLDELSDEARACQAVNLVKKEGLLLKGYNTDGAGLLRGLKENGIDPQGRVMFVGAGGAARSIAFAMARAGMLKADFLDIDYGQAEAMAHFIATQSSVPASAALMTQENFARLAAQTDILINCSPVGMSPRVDEAPVESLDRLNHDAVVCDIIYNPRRTKLLQMAQSRGLKTIDGLPMFINQALLTLEILLKQSFEAQEMEEVISRYVQA
ncbi:MAG: shikimate dehydrogenase [Syntrophomonadaceae bacterium]|nr:shikimate dehydrogenase [Syntrophomonadaceae bacterium]